MEEKEVQKVKHSAIRLTPLNVLAAGSLVAAYFFLTGDASGAGIEKKVNWLFAVLCLFACLVAIISDLIFRKAIPSLKKLWVVECTLILFTLVLILIIKTIIF
jgi:hypothetical protein